MMGERMIRDYLISGEVIVEVNTLNLERLLNSLWSKGISIEEISRIDNSTVRFRLKYSNYRQTENEVRRLKGKIKIVKTEGILFYLIKIRRKLSLVIGVFLFLIGLYILSTYVWAIEITTQKNVAPFEIRSELNKLGIKPGIKKSSFSVYELEKKLENVDSEILWLRVRIEGATLKINIEEKVNPPKSNITDKGEVIAKKDGEVKRIFTESGKAAVKVGDIVKTGDILIHPIQGKEGFEYEVKPRGTVIANTFYEKVLETQTSGKKHDRTGERDSDIYLNIFDKKIYLKKAINSFISYDKIEESKGFINVVTYYEKGEVEVKLDKDTVIKRAEEDLRRSLEKNLSNEAKVLGNDTTVEDLGGGKTRVRVVFIVEENIA